MRPPLPARSKSKRYSQPLLQQQQQQQPQHHRTLHQKRHNSVISISPLVSPTTSHGGGGGGSDDDILPPLPIKHSSSGSSFISKVSFCHIFVSHCMSFLVQQSASSYVYIVFPSFPLSSSTCYVARVCSIYGCCLWCAVI